MNDVLRGKLVELIRQEGPGFLQERARLEGMLWLAIGEHGYGMFALMGALERHIPQAILTAPPERRNAELFDKLIRRLVSDLDLDESTAQWAVESWQLAVHDWPQQTPPTAPRVEAKPEPVSVPPRRVPPPAPTPENFAGVPQLSLDGPDQPARAPRPFVPPPNPPVPVLIGMGLDSNVFLRGHQDAVTCLACSPDGQTIVTGSADRTLILWDANGTKRAVLSCKDRVNAVAFAPDGRLLASASADGSIQLWDARRGQERGLLPCAKGWPTALAFAPDGKKLLVGGKDGEALLWKVDDGGEAHHTLAGHSDELLAVAFSPTGLSVATAGEDCRTKLWDVARGRAWASLTGHHEAVTGVAFASDGKLLATVSRDGSVKLWNAVTGREIGQLEVDRQQFSEVLRCVAFAPDGRTLAAGAEDNSVHVWDVANRQQLASFGNCGGPVASIAFTPDGRWLLAAGADGLVRRWQAPVARRRPLYEEPIRRPLRPASGTGKKAGAIGGTLVLLVIIILAVSLRVFSNMNSGNRNNDFNFHHNNHPQFPQGQFQQQWEGPPRSWFGHAGGVASVAVSKDGLRILSGGFDNTVRLWNFRDNGLLASLGGPGGHTAPVLAVAFSPTDGTKALSASLDRTVKLWDLTTNQVIRTYPHDTGVTSVAFSKDGKRFVSGCGFDKVVYTPENLPQQREQLKWQRPNGHVGAVVLWEVETGVSTRLPMPPNSDQISSVTFSAQDRQIVGGCFDKTILVWNAENYQRLFQFQGHQGEVFAVAAVPNPDGLENFNKVVSGATKLGNPDQLKKENRQQNDPAFPIRVWDLQLGLAERQFPANLRGVLSVAVSPDGNRLLTTGFDRAVFLWDLNTGQELRRYQSPRMVNSVTFSPDGRFAVWGSWDGTVQVWRL